MKKGALLGILLLLCVLSACASAERAEIPMVVRYRKDGVGVPVSVDPASASFLMSKIAEPGVYEQIFYGRVVACWLPREGSALARGVNTAHYHHDESGALYSAGQEYSSVLKGPPQLVEYRFWYAEIVVEVISCVKGGLQPGDQVHLADVTMWGDTTSDRQPGDEEIFCINLDRVGWTMPICSMIGEVRPESRVEFEWRIDGLPVPEGHYTDSTHKSFTGIQVQDGQVARERAENFRWDPKDWNLDREQTTVPVEEYLKLLSDAVEANERELEAYLQEPVSIEGLTVDASTGVVEFQVPARDGDVLYVEQQLPDGSYQIKGGISNGPGRASDFYAQHGETYHYRCYLVGLKYPFLSNAPQSESVEVTVTVPEEQDDLPEKIEKNEGEKDGVFHSEVKYHWKLSSYPGLVRRSDLIVYGMVQDKGASRRDEDYSIYHNVYVKVEECYLGDAGPGARISYKEDGGALPGKIQTGNFPQVEAGAKVVLYLFEGSRDIKPDQLVDLSSGTVTLRKSSVPGYRMSETALIPPAEDNEEITLSAEEYLKLLRADFESADVPSGE